MATSSKICMGNALSLNFQEFVAACKLTVKAGGTFASTSEA